MPAKPNEKVDAPPLEKLDASRKAESDVPARERTKQLSRWDGEGGAPPPDAD